eukprot:730-Chlamydomonas_euryale.AAC.4
MHGGPGMRPPPPRNGDMQVPTQVEQSACTRVHAYKQPSDSKEHQLALPGRIRPEPSLGLLQMCGSKWTLGCCCVRAHGLPWVT